MVLGAIAIAGVALLILVIYLFSADQINARTDRILKREAVRMQSIPSEDVPHEIDSSLARDISGLNYYALLDSSGHRIAGNLTARVSALNRHPHDLAAQPGIRTAIRLLAVPVGKGDMLLIGRDITLVVDLRQRVTVIFVASGLVILLLMLTLGTALSLAPLRRVSHLQNVARRIAAGRFDERMPLTGRDDEFDQFARTVNAMVEEVAQVVNQTKSVTDAIAHDLRTPFTRVRGRLSQIRTKNEGNPTLVSALDAAIGDLDHALGRFAGLLRISEIEARTRRAGFAPVDVGDLLATLIDLYRPLAEERTQNLTCHSASALCLFADGSLLFEALSNLLDNAIKYAPTAGHISISASRDVRGAVRITVADDGPGIAPGERATALHRFERGIVGSGISGYGLGLSIVAAIAHLHQFELELRDNEPGLAIALVTPPDAVIAPLPGEF
ncbi:sensor histidine kinase [Novosphingobium sp. 9]|uniref:HAMP domain-containing sensor histidine kinase n=1 Tax=Novosphingobium sp. 9 TaxID=2025349 RepID=UPI0021B57567|nr:HAMP domain-containing sensor histidine kinase [Novosphingobium sp. 9]